MTCSAAFHTNSGLPGYIVTLHIDNKASHVRRLQPFPVLDDETNRDAVPLFI